MEKLLKKAEDAMTGKRYSEALTWLKQAKILALPDKQKEIDEKMAEVQKRHRREACSAWNNRQCPSRSRLHNRRHRNTGAESKSLCSCPNSRIRFRNPSHNRKRLSLLHTPDSRKRSPYNICNRSHNRQFHNLKESSSINRYRCRNRR